MIILHVAPISTKYFSGLNLSIPSTARAQHNLNHEVCILTTSKRGPYETIEPFPVIYAYENKKKKRIADLPAPFNKPDIIIFHSTYIYHHIILAKEAVKSGIPYIITPRGGMTLGAQRQKRIKKTIGNILFFNHFVKNASAIHCLTEKEAADSNKWGKDIFIVGNGIDLPQIDSIQKKESNQFVITFIGRLDIHHKGLDLLVQACGLIREVLEQERVIVRLYGPDQNNSRKVLMDMINSLNLTKVVKMHGPVKGEHKANALIESDIFVHTSRFEGHPMSVLEALSYGVPCLLTPGTNVSSEVREFGAGWEVEGNKNAIAERMLQVIKQKTNLDEYRYKARKLVEDRYTWDKISKKLVQNYLEIIQKFDQ